MKEIHFEGISSIEMESLRKEALLMRFLVLLISNLCSEIAPHPNVVVLHVICYNMWQLSLIGVTLPPDPVILLTEFCEHGSLHDYVMPMSSIPLAFMQVTLIGICRGTIVNKNWHCQRNPTPSCTQCHSSRYCNEKYSIGQQTHSQSFRYVPIRSITWYNLRFWAFTSDRWWKSLSEYSTWLGTRCKSFFM